MTISRESQAIRGSRRMAAVQAPAIAGVGDLMRATPGTISLGQGVVGYGPPAQAMERIRNFLADPQNHKYQAVHGIPQLLAQLERKLRAENAVELGPERALVVTAGGNMAFMNAVLAIVDPGDEVIITAPGITDRCALRVSYGPLDRETAGEGIGRLVGGLRAVLKGS